MEMQMSYDDSTARHRNAIFPRLANTAEAPPVPCATSAARDSIRATSSVHITAAVLFCLSVCVDLPEQKHAFSCYFLLSFCCGHKGIYFSPFTWKSHGYSAGSTKNTNVRTMLLCRVIAGKSAVYGAAAAAVGDPNSVDSVVGGPTNKTKKFSELVVFDGDAALPCYVLCCSF